jgi:hypothetical protein
MKLTPRLAAVAATLTALTAGLAGPQAASAVTASAAAPVLRASAPARPITLVKRNRITVGESVHQAIVLPAGPQPHGLAFHAATPLPATKYSATTHLYRVLVRILNRSGAPVGPPAGSPGGATYSVMGPIVNTATAGTPASVGYNRKLGAYSVRVPAGDYYLDGLVATPGYSAVMVQPDVAVHANTTVTLDARAADPVSVKVDHPGAAPLLEYAEIDQTIDGTPVSSSYGVENSPGKPRQLYLTPTVAVTGRPFLFSLHASLTSPAAFPTGRRSRLRPARYEYNLLFTHRGVPASLAYRVGAGQLATVATHYYGETATLPKSDIGQQGNLPLGPGNDELYSYDAPVVIAPAGRATMYYVAPPGITWSSEDLLDDNQAAPSDLQSNASYQPGRHYTDSFGEAALGAAGDALRMGNAMEFFPAPFSPSEPGHVLQACCGLSIDGSKVHSTLWRGGKMLAHNSDPWGFGLTVPAARGRYTLTETATRPASDWSVLGTQSSATWSFFSARPQGTDGLPLLTVRTAGPFSSSGALPAGKTVPLSLSVDGIPQGARLTSLTVSASSDGGKTWRPLHVYRVGQRWRALVTTRAGGYVSLRTAATDSAGDAAVITTIRAFAVTQGTSAGR